MAEAAEPPNETTEERRTRFMNLSPEARLRALATDSDFSLISETIIELRRNQDTEGATQLHRLYMDTLNVFRQRPIDRPERRIEQAQAVPAVGVMEEERRLSEDGKDSLVPTGLNVELDFGAGLEEEEEQERIRIDQDREEVLDDAMYNPQLIN